MFKFMNSLADNNYVRWNTYTAWNPYILQRQNCRTLMILLSKLNCCHYNSDANNSKFSASRGILGARIKPSLESIG